MEKNYSTFMVRCFALFLTSICLASMHSTVFAQTAQEVAKKAFGATVLLVMEDANGQPLSLGSGFLVRNGEVASNLHVIEGAASGYAKIVGQKTKFDIEGITAVDPRCDLVVLKISGCQAEALVLGDSESVQVGETVYAIGNPQGLEGTFSQGIVSSIREVEADKLLQITAPISPGSSGGPVLNCRGEVIGVSVATFRGGQNLNFAIPSNYLNELLKKTGSAKPLAQAKPATLPRSILGDLGGRSREGVVGANLTYDSYSQMGNYSFSLVNKLRDPVKNVYCLIVFYDKQGIPLDVQTVKYHGQIPGGLAKRVKGRVDQSVERLNANHHISPPHSPGGKIEFRILDFEVVH